MCQDGTGALRYRMQTEEEKVQNGSTVVAVWTPGRCNLKKNGFCKAMRFGASESKRCSVGPQ